MPQTTLALRCPPSFGVADVKAILVDSGPDAADTLAAHQHLPGTHLLLTGDRDFYVVLDAQPSPELLASLRAFCGNSLMVVFPGRTPVRRRLASCVSVKSEAAAGAEPDAASSDDAPTPEPTASTPYSAIVALDLNDGRTGAAPLFLLPDGALSEQSSGPAPQGEAAAAVLLTAARWISTRRTSTFERLYPPSAFHPEQALRNDRLTAEQAKVLLGQAEGALRAAAVDGALASRDATAAAQLRSAALTVLSHIVATLRKDPSYAGVAAAATEAIFGLIDRETSHGNARPALRAHAIQLLQMRGPALTAPARERVTTLLKGLIRQSPPYEGLNHLWRFAMCSAWDFHEGECDVLLRRYNFKEVSVESPPPALPLPASRYRVLQAPFKNPAGQPILIYSRSASPSDENLEMGVADFVGVLINRHAQLGAFDMQASTIEVRQAGYKLMMNSQCAGLTTRFAVSKMFPDADIYSSWDSTYFRTDSASGKVSDSEGLDCFVALLTGMSNRETHAQLAARMKQEQWHHEQSSDPHFMQFVGPSHPLVTARYSDVNQDGRADYYDGFLDFTLREIKSDLENGATPRDPGVAASQVGGDAAKGLGWAAGSLNRVTQYSDLWRGLPGESELFYVFSAAGFYSHREPPRDVPVGKSAESQGPEVDLGQLPSVSRYLQAQSTQESVTESAIGEDKLRVDVMFHSHLSHAPWELKRLLCAAEAHRRALDLGVLPATGPLSTQLGQRGALLLTLAGLLEFPADQNRIDGLWSTALRLLNLPSISRSLVRGCINQADHDASNYYGSLRGLGQLIGNGRTDGDGGDLKRADPAAYAKLAANDPTVGRALPLKLS
jgi:hypothetical protein